MEGADALQQVDRGLGRAEVSALGLLAGVTAVNAAFFVMMNRAVDAAVGLDRWQRSTGLQVETLQRLQYGAARANVAASTIADGIKQIQKTRAEISLGNVDASSPWFLLGIDPRQDPLKVLEQLRVALSSMDPALARTMTSRMGFGEDMHYLLQQKQAFGSIFVNRDEIERLAQLGGAWRGFLFNVSNVATKFAASFADGLTKVVGWLERGVTVLDRFTRWLNSGTSGANAARGALLGLVGVLVLAMVALGGIVFLLGLLKAALIAVQLIPIVAALTAVVAVLALMAAGIAFLVLMIQDFWTAIEGGKSLFEWNDGLLLTIRNVEKLAHGIQVVIDTWRQLKGDPNFRGAFIQEAVKAGGSYGSGYGFVRDFVNWNYRRRGGQGGGSQNSAEVNIHVNGAGDPAATGREVGRSVKREISDAFGTAPLATN